MRRPFRPARALSAKLCCWAGLSLAGCATAAGTAPDGDIGWRANPRSVPEPAEGYAFPAQVFAGQIEHYSHLGEGSGGLTIDMSEAPDGVIVIATRTGILDDSVEAEQERVLLNLREGGRWHVRERGIRFRCWRGPRPRQWTTELCP